MPEAHEPVTIVPDNANFYPVAQNWPLYMPTDFKPLTAMIYFFCLAKHKTDLLNGIQHSELANTFIGTAFRILNAEHVSPHRRKLIEAGLLVPRDPDNSRCRFFSVTDWPDYMTERAGVPAVASLLAESERQHNERRDAVARNIAERNAATAERMRGAQRDEHGRVMPEWARDDRPTDAPF